MTELVVGGVSRISRIFGAAEEIRNACSGAMEAERSGLTEKRRAVAEIKSLLPRLVLVREMVQAVARPATEQEIAAYLAQLLKAFPNTGKAESSAFGRLLLEDVIDQRPTVGAMEAGCREVRQTSKFLPVISEVLAAVSRAELAIRSTLERIDELPAVAAGLEQQIEGGERRGQEKRPNGTGF